MNEQVQGILKQISVTQRIGIAGAALAAVAMIGVLVMFASKPEYTPAFTKVSAADAATIEGALRTANIAYQVTDAGTTIEVPVDSLGDARIAAGGSADLHTVMLQMEEASISLKAAVDVRDKLLGAYQEIMRTQL